MRRAVVKLGGSTASSAEMDMWISALAGSTLPLVIVPGGGPFADQVREAQTRLAFSDMAAHAMAILAMDQFGHVILDRNESLAAAQSLDDIRRLLGEDRTPVWLPSSAAIPASEVPATWDVTSDSLAAWLTRKIGADSLLLIKQTGAFSADDTVDSLTAGGIVDAALPTMLPAGVDLYLAGPHDAVGAAGMLAAGEVPGIRILRTASMARRAG